MTRQLITRLFNLTNKAELTFKEAMELASFSKSCDDTRALRKQVLHLTAEQQNKIIRESEHNTSDYQTKAWERDFNLAR